MIIKKIFSKLLLLFMFLISFNAIAQTFTDITLDGNFSLQGGIAPPAPPSGTTTFDMTDANNYYELIPLATVSQSGFLQTNVFARGRFLTTATSATIVAYNNVFDSFPGYADIGIRINGSDFTALNFTKSGFETFNVTFPLGSKIIEVITGLTSSKGVAGAIFGSWPTSIVFNDDDSATKSAPTQTNRMVIYGDSITVGDDAVNPSLQGWPLLVRNRWQSNGTPGTVIEFSYGYGALADRCTSVGTCQTLADILTQNLSGATNKYIYIQVSTNDFGLNKSSAATFGVNYARLLSAIHSNDPTINIYAQTAVYRGTETANSFGSTLENFRTEVINACNAVSTYCTTVDGKTILSRWSDYNTDHLHPSLSGQTSYANFIYNLLGI